MPGSRTCPPRSHLLTSFGQTSPRRCRRERPGTSTTKTDSAVIPEHSGSRMACPDRGRTDRTTPVTTMRDLSGELRLPVAAVAKCLLDFGLVRTVSQELAETEIALVRENVERLRRRE